MKHSLEFITNFLSHGHISHHFGIRARLM